MRGWRSCFRRASSRARARPCWLCSTPRTARRSRPGWRGAKVRRRDACAIWLRRFPLASRVLSRCASRSTSGGRPASICVSSASPRREARAGSWRRRRLWARRMASRPRLGIAKVPRPKLPGRRTIRRSASWAKRLRRIPAFCGPSTARAGSASRIQRSSPRLGPTRPAAASRLRLLSAAPNWTAARRWRVRSASGGRSPASEFEWPLPEPGRRRQGRAFGRAAVRPPSRIFGLPRLWRAGSGVRGRRGA